MQERNDTVWTQCLEKIIKLSRLRGVEVDIAEVDRLAALVTQEIRIIATKHIEKIVGDPENKFDDPIPF